MQNIIFKSVMSQDILFNLGLYSWQFPCEALKILRWTKHILLNFPVQVGAHFLSEVQHSNITQHPIWIYSVSNFLPVLGAATDVIMVKI